MPIKPFVPAGAMCRSDPRGAAPRQSGPWHRIEHWSCDEELRQVEQHLLGRPNLRAEFTKAVDEAVTYVLDGARTGRFDLNDPEVDSDERRSVGTKLQYRLIDALGLVKQPPLDTVIVEVAVDIKGTVGSNWTIPKEAQCEICILVQVDAARERHQAFVMRTHRRWLNDGLNDDNKRSIAKTHNFLPHARPLYGWEPMPPNPLKLLTPQQRDIVFADGVGQERRLTALFGFLPNVVVPRWAILTVGKNRKDTMRRSRAIKDLVAQQHGLTVLVGKWVPERQAALALGFDLDDEDWVATDRVIGPALPP